MANEIMKEIKTRIALRTGDYAYWTTGAGKDIELLKGEVCVCTIAVADNQAQTAPTVLLKICDVAGKKFGDLKWTSALAADVYEWAKAANVVFENEHILFKNATGGTIKDLDLSVFVTAAELTTELAKYYTKTEIDNLFGQVVNTVTTVSKGTGIDVTDAGTAGNHAYTVALDVEGAKTALGLKSAAYETVDNLNATAKGYADAVEEKLPTSADYGVLGITAGDDTITIGGTAQNPTVKVTANKFDAYGAAAQALADAKDYADKKPHENTAHSHSAGAGLAVTGNGGISGNVEYALNVAFELVGKTIKLYDKDDVSKTAIATLDATEFIADGMLASVTADQDNNKLVFEWNTDAGVTKTEIPLSSIADIYTGANGTEVNVAVSNQNVISASLNSEVAAKIANGETAYNWGNHASAGYAANSELDKVIDGTTPVAKAINAVTLGNQLPAYYATKTSVDAIPSIIDGKISTYDAGKNFGDIITHNVAEFATNGQGAKADTALQEITTTENNGLKVTNKNNIDIDTDVVFVLDCNW